MQQLKQLLAKPPKTRTQEDGNAFIRLTYNVPFLVEESNRYGLQILLLYFQEMRFEMVKQGSSIGRSSRFYIIVQGKVAIRSNILEEVLSQAVDSFGCFNNQVQPQSYIALEDSILLSAQKSTFARVRRKGEERVKNKNKNLVAKLIVQQPLEKIRSQPLLTELRLFDQEVLISESMLVRLNKLQKFERSQFSNAVILLLEGELELAFAMGAYKVTRRVYENELLALEGLFSQKELQFSGTTFSQHCELAIIPFSAFQHAFTLYSELADKMRYLAEQREASVKRDLHALIKKMKERPVKEYRDSQFEKRNQQLLSLERIGKQRVIRSRSPFVPYRVFLDSKLRHGGQTVRKSPTSKRTPFEEQQLVPIEDEVHTIQYDLFKPESKVREKLLLKKIFATFEIGASPAPDNEPRIEYKTWRSNRPKHLYSRKLAREKRQELTFYE